MLNLLKVYLINKMNEKIREEKGQSMVEYALIIGLVAIVVIAVLIFLGPAIADLFQDIIDALSPGAAE